MSSRLVAAALLAGLLLAPPASARKPTADPSPTGKRGPASWLGTGPTLVPPTEPVPSSSLDGSRVEPLEREPLAVHEPRAPYRVAAFRPDGRATASPGQAPGVVVEDRFPFGLRPREVARMATEVTALEYSPRGDRLAVGDRNGEVAVWSLHPPLAEPVARLRWHHAPIVDLAFHPDGGALAVASGEPVVTVWRLHDGAKVRELEVEDGREPRALAISPDGERIAIGDQAGATLWHLDKSAVLRRLPGPRAVSALAFSPEGRYLAVARDPSPTRLHDLLRGEEVASVLAAGGAGPDALAFSRAGTRLATPFGVDRVAIWEEPRTGRRIRTFHVMTPAITALHFLPDDESVGYAGSVFRGVAGRWGLSPDALREP